ncbi:UNVERIFIED_CONTAM: hypothetical protein HDU68_007410 [Siphonaria sp. JEL0065]|nr:hypothetical protein HDU68_007410 [Siphonaria sp. JEL0065]
MMASNLSDDDFLDDLLDDFDAPPAEHPVSSAAAATAATAATATTLKAPAKLSQSDFESDFEAQLALGMEKLLSDFSKAAAASPIASDANIPPAESIKETMEALMGALKHEGVKAKEAKSKSTKSADFHSVIDDTLSQLKESKEKVETELDEQPSENPEDIEAMMKELETMMGSAEFEDMFGNVMGQLMNRDLLYEPMKDLAAKYPEYLQENKNSISPEDYQRFTSQHQIVVQIMKVYDDDSVTGDEEQKQVGDLMQKMQELGNPPDGIMQDLTPGMEMGPDGLPKFPGLSGGEGAPDCSDHMRGLDNPAFCSPIYCSEVTGRMLPFVKAGKYDHLKTRIKYIPMFESMTIRTHNGDCVLVTAFPANHCAGSTMFLFELKGRRVLYTGDVRADDSLMKDILSTSDVFCNSFGTIKQIDTVYIDTTFCDKKLRVFPSKTDSITALTSAISKRPPTTTYSLNLLSLGYEPFIIGLASHFSTKIHVSQDQYNLYASYSSSHPTQPDENMLKYVTRNPKNARFHFRCDCWKVEQGMVRVKATTMPWCDSLSRYLSSKSRGGDEGEQVETLDPAGFSMCEESEYMIHVFYAMHSSYNELRSLIRVIKPYSVHACVLDTSSVWNNADMFSAFDDLLGTRKSGITSGSRFSTVAGSSSTGIKRGKSIAELLLEDLMNGKVPAAVASLEDVTAGVESQQQQQSSCETEEMTQSLDVTQLLESLGNEDVGLIGVLEGMSGNDSVVVEAEEERHRVLEDANAMSMANRLEAKKHDVTESLVSLPGDSYSHLNYGGDAPISMQAKPTLDEVQVPADYEALHSSSLATVLESSFTDAGLHSEGNKDAETHHNLLDEYSVSQHSDSGTQHTRVESGFELVATLDAEWEELVPDSFPCGIDELPTSLQSEKCPAIASLSSNGKEVSVVSDSQRTPLLPSIPSAPLIEDDFDDSVVIVDGEGEGLYSRRSRRNSESRTYVANCADSNNGFSDDEDLDPNEPGDWEPMSTPRQAPQVMTVVESTPPRNRYRDDSPIVILSSPVHSPMQTPVPNRRVEVIDLTFSSDDEDAPKRTFIVPDSQQSTPAKAAPVFPFSMPVTPVALQSTIPQPQISTQPLQQKRKRKSASPIDLTGPTSSFFEPSTTTSIPKPVPKKQKSATPALDWVQSLNRRNSSFVSIDKETVVSKEDVLEKERHIRSGGEFVLECTFPFRKEDDGRGVNK